MFQNKIKILYQLPVCATLKLIVYFKSFVYFTWDYPIFFSKRINHGKDYVGGSIFFISRVPTVYYIQKIIFDQSLWIMKFIFLFTLYCTWSFLFNSNLHQHVKVWNKEWTCWLYCTICTYIPPTNKWHCVLYMYIYVYRMLKKCPVLYLPVVVISTNKRSNERRSAKQLFSEIHPILYFSILWED